MKVSRRKVIASLGIVLAAPAIIRTPGLIMPVRVSVDHAPTDLAAFRKEAIRRIQMWRKEPVLRREASEMVCPTSEGMREEFFAFYARKYPIYAIYDDKIRLSPHG